MCPTLVLHRSVDQSVMGNAMVQGKALPCWIAFPQPVSFPVGEVEILAKERGSDKL